MSGVPELLVLRLLDQREMYGYELVRAIRTATNDTITPGEGVVYPVLHSLERGKLLKARRKPVSGRTRVYYAITTKGQERLAALKADWLRIQSGIEAAMETSA